MNDPADWLMLIQQGRAEIRAIADALSGLAFNFKRTGNGTVADDLSWFAERLRAAEEEIDKGEGLEVSRNLHHAQETSGLLVKVALAGALSRKGER